MSVERTKMSLSLKPETSRESASIDSRELKDDVMTVKTVTKLFWLSEMTLFDQHRVIRQRDEAEKACWLWR